ASLYRAHAAAHGLGDVACGIEGERSDTSPDLAQANADYRQREENQEDLYQERSAAHEVHIAEYDASKQSHVTERAQAEDEAQDTCEHTSNKAHLQSNERTFCQKRDRRLHDGPVDGHGLRPVAVELPKLDRPAQRRTEPTSRIG